MHTHAHVESQFGETICASAKPEKKTNNASGVARSDIWECPAALRMGGLKGTGSGAQYQSMNGFIYWSLLIGESSLVENSSGIPDCAENHLGCSRNLTDGKMSSKSIV